MSDRMTNVDYGDVLSSIRRLVEEEAGAAPIAVGSDPIPVGPDPLVLTPALRVVSALPDAVPAAPFIDVAEGWMPEDAAEEAPDEAADEVPAGALRTASVLAFTARGQAPDSRGEDPAADDAEAAAIAEIRAAEAEDAPPIRDAHPALPDAPGDEVVIDEDRLREIVREVIREELQGTMGERITRNIRKLVRAEIHRAVLARDLD